MFNIDKKNALFIHGVVIANGIPDADNDVLSKEDIKRLNSSYLSHDTDTNHDFLKNNGIEIIENYISKTEETIHDKKVPKGSWLATMMIWDNDLKSQIRQGRLNGFSLASQPNCEIKKEGIAISFQLFIIKRYFILIKSIVHKILIIINVFIYVCYFMSYCPFKNVYKRYGKQCIYRKTLGHQKS